MRPKPTVDDLVGIEYGKLGFFGEVQKKIAELQASNQELAQKQRHIQAILNGIADVMVVLSLDLRIKSVNRVFFDIYPEPEPVGKFCYQAFRNQQHPCAACPAVIASDTNQVCSQLTIYPVNGTNRHFRTTASPLRNDEGKPCHILLLKRDITLEQEYQAKYYQAETMATMGVLAAGVGHEINNPLTAVSGFAEALQRRLGQLEGGVAPELLADFQEYLGIILKECHRCQEIVQNLLTLSPRKSSALSFLQINDLLKETLRLLHNHLKQYPPNHVRLDLDGALPAVHGDPSQLKQVILNLLFNALDATSSKGSVTIRTYVIDQDWVGIAFQDSGCGIPAAHRDKLFEPFFTTKPVGKGIGIGLSTCYNIVQNHGGEIAVDSKEGQGSTFLVRLCSARSHAAV
jgi:two-component system, NtrC family, sensor kinase